MRRLLAIGLLILAQPAAAQELRISNVTIVSPERSAPLRGMDVILKDGRIAAISKTSAAPKMATLDGKGLYLTPGLIDSHVHLGMISGMTAEQEAKHPEIAKAAWAQMPKSFLMHGYTTVIDLLSTKAGMARWKSTPLIPDTFFCGGAVLMDGYPTNFIPEPARHHALPYMLMEDGAKPPPGVDPKDHTPAAVVARMKADVKTTFERGFGAARNLPVPRLDTIRDLVRAARAQGLPVMLHANGLEAHQFGVDAGVDVIVHGMWNVPPDSEETRKALRGALDGVIAKRIGWQPTAQVIKGLRDLFDPKFLSDPLLAQVQPASLIAWYGTPEGQWFHREIAGEAGKTADMYKAFAPPITQGLQGLSYLASHGGRLLFGTDTPSAPTYANPPGLNGWMEMQNWIAAGVTPAQIFKAATLANAQAMNLDRDIGTVEVGKRANLLLLRGDPTRTIQAYQGIVKVFLGGRMLDPAELAAKR